jgi:hypothetical protein
MMVMHPLHLGVLHLNINSQNHANIEVRLFTDDLESAVFHFANKEIVIDVLDDNTLKLVSNYLIDKVKIYNGNEAKAIKLLSIKKDKDVTIIEYETTLGDWSSFKFCCEVFFELFNDQTNLLIVKTPSLEEGFRVDQYKSCVIVEN